MARGNIKVTTRVTKSSKKKSSTTPSSNTTKIVTRSTKQPKDNNNNNNNDHNDNGEVGDNDEVILDDSETKLVIGQEFILSQYNSYEEMFKYLPHVGLIGIAAKAGTGEDEIIKLMRNQLFEPNTDADGLPLLKCALDLHRLLMNGSVSLHLKAIAEAKYGSTITLSNNYF